MCAGVGAGVSRDGNGRGGREGRPEQDHELPVSTHLGTPTFLDLFLRSATLRSSLSIQFVIVNTFRLDSAAVYTGMMPKLWNETIEAHRRAVHDATLDAVATLVAEQGPMSVTMSRIARESGIGRATLYKYFSDVEEILLAWHERHVDRHLERLAEVRDGAGDAGGRLEAVLGSYALISREHHGMELGAHLAELLHRSEHAGRARRRLDGFVRGLLADAQETGDIRDDIAPEELSSYCLHALAAAHSLPSEAAIRRLVTVTLAGLRPPR